MILRPKYSTLIDEKPRIVSIIMQDSAPQCKPMTDDDDELDALEGVDGVEVMTAADYMSISVL